VVTEWNEFKEMDIKKVKKLLKQPVIVDGRNIYDPKKVKELGFRYYCIGRAF
jgi:UDPglucose 6-dehydrogenase